MSCDPLDDDPALPAAEVPYRTAFDYEATWRVGEAAAAQWATFLVLTILVYLLKILEVAYLW